MADRANRVWPAIAWAEGLLLVSLGAVGLAIASSLQSCDFLGGCAPGETSLEGESIVWLVFSAGAFVIGIFMASLASGWSRARAAVQATVALVAAGASLGLGVRASVALVDEFLPALVLAVGVAGIVAIRPSSPRAVPARLVVLAIFIALAIGVASAADLVIALTVLTLPAIGAADSLVRSTG